MYICVYAHVQIQIYSYDTNMSDTTPIYNVAKQLPNTHFEVFVFRLPSIIILS